MEVFIETERLILRELVRKDIKGMFTLDSDPEVHKYIGNDPLFIKEQALDEIFFIRDHYEDYGIGRWAVIDKKSNAFIGWAGLEFITEETNNIKDYYDLSYRIIQQYWNKGIATEASSAVLKYAFTTLNIKEVYAMAECENMSSKRVLEKIGMKYIEVFEMKGIKYDWYKIEKENFKKNS